MPQRTTNLEAYDYVLRGLEHFSTLTPDGLIEARKMFEKAIALDPSYADAYGIMGFTYFLDYVWEWDGDTAVEQAHRMAERATVLDDSNANAYALLGWIGALRGQYDTAIAEAKRAVALDTNSAFCEMALANIFMHAGDAQQGLAHAQKAMRLDPLHPEGYRFQEGLAYSSMGRYAEAVSALKASPQNDLNVHLALVYVYSQLGRDVDARHEAEEVMKLSPHFSLEVKAQREGWWFRPGAQHKLDLFRKAGLK